MNNRFLHKIAATCFYKLTSLSTLTSQDMSQTPNAQGMW